MSISAAANRAAEDLMRIPAQGLRFAAAVTFAPADAADDAARAGRRFSGTAYAGGTITDHGWWSAVAFDLAGLTGALPMPLLLQHDAERVIGVVERLDNDGTQVQVHGRLFTGIDAAADSVAAKADAGAPWQMSVGIFPDLVEELAADALVNGRAVRAGATVFRKSRVRETSFVALGADGDTRASVFSQSGGEHVARIHKEPPTMATPEPALAELQAQIAALTSDRDAQRTRADESAAAHAALQAQFAAAQRSEREAAVKALLGEEFSAEAAAPYMDMSAAQFAAVAARDAALRARLPAGFTAEQAAPAAGAGADPLAASALLASARQMFGIRQ